MKTKILFGAVAVLATSLMAADPTPKDDVIAAAKKLGDQTNYTWRTTVVVPEDSQYKPEPTDGMTEKDGFTQIKTSFFNNLFQIVVKGAKRVYTDQEGAWQVPSNTEEEGPERFVAMIVRNAQTPADEAAELAGFTKDLKKDGDAFAADLTEAGARAKLVLKGSGASAANPKGSVKFWLKDGALTKYEFKVTGTVNWNGNDIPVDRATTVEIKDIGKTKLEVPDEAKKKLS